MDFLFARRNILHYMGTGEVTKSPTPPLFRRPSCEEEFVEIS